MNELQHHGILGQKWGVRRYQNKDGTLTAEGKKRIQKATNDIWGHGKEYTNRQKVINESNNKVKTINKTELDMLKKRNPKAFEKDEYGEYKHPDKIKELQDKYGANKSYNEAVDEFVNRYSDAVLKDLKLKDSKEAKHFVKKTIEENKTYRFITGDRKDLIYDKIAEARADANKAWKAYQNEIKKNGNSIHTDKLFDVYDAYMMNLIDLKKELDKINGVTKEYSWHY